MSAATGSVQVAPAASADPLKPLTRLFRDLRISPAGLSTREAARRLEAYGPNELARRGGRRWPGELARQFTHPLALLLILAAALAWVSGSPSLGVAIAAVIVLNAAASHGLDASPAARAASRRQVFRFDPRLKLMITVDAQGGGLVVNTKGAAEEVLARATRIHTGEQERPLTAADRDKVSRVPDHASLQSVGVFTNRPGGEAEPAKVWSRVHDDLRC